ncbi:hypothetical protein sS8_3267 [Methylocaldum marinum]|uniref:Uncharacterized protein n=1 Tax=Methylocaldum marinum TaxID=1432792 RepID=A0A250KU78_9GAMM|nr:hypothetical protein sS8_3267 [Methylocaldum marinum]
MLQEAKIRPATRFHEITLYRQQNDEKKENGHWPIGSQTAAEQERQAEDGSGAAIQENLMGTEIEQEGDSEAVYRCG